MNTQFDPISALRRRRTPQMVDYKGRPLQVQPPTYNPFTDPLPCADSWQTRLGDIAFRDPEHFVSGQSHEHVLQWDQLLDLNSNELSHTVKSWIHDKVDILTSGSHTREILLVCIWIRRYRLPTFS